MCLVRLFITFNCSFDHRISEKSKNLPISINKVPPAFDATDSMPNGVRSPRRKSDGVTKHNPEIYVSQAKPPNDSDQRSQSVKPGKSKPTVTVQETLGTGSIPDLAIGTTKRRRSSVGSPFHRRAQSTERQPRTTEQMPTPRPVSATGRARSVDPLGPELGRSLPPSASRSRERPAKDSNVLIIARNKEGKHRVKDSPKEQNAKINSAEGTAPLNDNPSFKYPQQQQQSKTKASRMLINTNKLHPIKPRPLLVRSTSESLESKEDVERPETEGSSNHELRRTASFGSTPVTTEPDDDRTTAGTVEFSSPLSPTKPDILLEEYRKIGLEIQDLIKNAEDLDNSRCQADGQSNSKVSDEDRNMLNLLEATPNRNETLAETRRRVSMTTRLPSANSINCTSRIEKPAGQTDGHGRSSSAAGLEDKPHAGTSQSNFIGLEKDPGLGAAVERSRCTMKATNQKIPRTRSSSREPVKEMTLPRSSSITRNQRALSCTSRTRGRTMDENCDSGRSKRINADNCFDPRRMGHEEEDSSQHRSRTTFARNRDKGLSIGSGEFVSDATQQNAVSTPLRNPRGASNSRCPSAEPDQTRRPEVTSLHAADDTDRGLSTNVDGYCRKALIRKDIVSGQKTSSRIPMPVEVRQSLQLKGYGSGQLKRVDSGVDINNISP